MRKAMLTTDYLHALKVGILSTAPGFELHNLNNNYSDK